MEQNQDRETRIGAALLLGLAAFALVGLMSFYFHQPTHDSSERLRDQIAATR